MESRLHIRPQYFRLYVDPGVEPAERNYRYRELDWRIPLAQAALVCVDVWNWHFSSDTLSRMEDITVNRIVPLAEACRRKGVRLIHAPATPVADKHPNWLRLIPEDEKPRKVWERSPRWPPPDFLEKKGQYASHARPHEPQEAERTRHREEDRDFHPALRPKNDEAVIRSGEELHRFCADQGILFLFYAGFCTNVCMVRRDYGICAMQSRGYEVILVRDCTTGMETHETHQEMVCTSGQIATLQQLGVCTVTSEHFVKALAHA
jgi:nicotinamidase-related amidase